MLIRPISRPGFYPVFFCEKEHRVSPVSYTHLDVYKRQDESHFYEIEAVRNDWSLTELKGSLILRCMKGWHLAGIKKV